MKTQTNQVPRARSVLTLAQASYLVRQTVSPFPLSVRCGESEFISTMRSLREVGHSGLDGREQAICAALDAGSLTVLESAEAKQ